MKNNKNKIMITIIAVALVLVVTIGASYAYFTSNISSNGDNKIEASTVVLASARMDYGDKVVASGILPGNKILKTINVTGSGPDNAEAITATIILTPNVVDFGSHVKYTIYAVENSTIDKTTICEEPKPTTEDGKYFDSMECDTSNLGTPVLSGTFENKKVVTKEIEVTSTTNTTYYLLIEYVNDPDGQDEEQGKTFTINIDFQSVYTGPRIQQKFMVDGSEVYDLPTKQEYYEIAVTCSDNKPRTWNYETWSLNIEEDLEESCTCSLEFNKNANKYIECIAKDNEELAYDETTDNNLRYIGANPNNYVLFNNELWRIIGVMNNIEDSEGNKGSHIKLIRNESIGNYPWSGSSSNQSNDWTKSTLNTNVLNGTYYTGLTSESKNMIGNVVWNLGGREDGNVIASVFYANEHGTTVYGNNPITWIGKIGLMYPSDYGYAVGKDLSKTCLETNLTDYDTKNCPTNNWLYLDGSHQWTLMTVSSDPVNHAFCIYGYDTTNIYRKGNVYADLTFYYSYVVKPTLYLNSNVQIISDESHNGSQDKPFELKSIDY